MTQFRIRANGWRVGTCGWLSAGLTDGTIVISPGTSTRGKGGLWIATPIGSACLAIFNQWDLEDVRQHEFSIVEHDGGFCSSLPLTPASRAYLEDMAREWCDAANAERLSDTPESLPRLVVAS